MWQEMHILSGGPRKKREAGTWLFGQFIPEGGSGGGAGSYGPPDGVGYGGPVVNPEANPICCPCQQGPVGPPGPPGDDGPDGHDGQHGKDGENGKDGQVGTLFFRRFQIALFSTYDAFYLVSRVAEASVSFCF